MSDISVQYVDHMGSDLSVANCARVSFGKWKNELDASDTKLIDYLANHGHSSPFRHPQIQLRCTAPLFLARQLQKHTVGLTWNEISRRYVDVGVEFFVPNSWRSRPDNGIKQGSGDDLWSQKSITEPYKEFLEHAQNLYDWLLHQGVAPEQARMCLPQSMMCSWVWTGSLQAFYHVYSLRSGEGAQQEAKDFAILLEDIVSKLFPHCWLALKGEQHGTATN